MKKKVFGIVLVLILLISAAGCGQPVKASDHLEDYVFTMAYHDNFNILQLTDIHWNANTSAKSSMAYMDKVIKEANDHIVETQGPGAKIDLVELTGDMFMLVNEYHLTTFIDYFEENYYGDDISDEIKQLIAYTEIYKDYIGEENISDLKEAMEEYCSDCNDEDDENEDDEDYDE